MQTTFSFASEDESVSSICISFSMQRACCVCELDSWIRKSWKSCSFAVHCCDVCMRWHIFISASGFSAFFHSPLFLLSFSGANGRFAFEYLMRFQHRIHIIIFLSLLSTSRWTLSRRMTWQMQTTSLMHWRWKKSGQSEIRKYFAMLFLCKHTKKAKKKAWKVNQNINTTQQRGAWRLTRKKRQRKRRKFYVLYSEFYDPHLCRTPPLFHWIFYHDQPHDLRCSWKLKSSLAGVISFFFRWSG